MSDTTPETPRNGLSRKTSLDALQALANADALINAKLHTHNVFRLKTIDAMCAELGVEVRKASQ